MVTVLVAVLYRASGRVQGLDARRAVDELGDLTRSGVIDYFNADSRTLGRITDITAWGNGYFLPWKYAESPLLYSIARRDRKQQYYNSALQLMAVELSTELSLYERHKLYGVHGVRIIVKALTTPNLLNYVEARVLQGIYEDHLGVRKTDTTEELEHQSKTWWLFGSPS